jgi:hypothetical protein
VREFEIVPLDDAVDARLSIVTLAGDEQKLDLSIGGIKRVNLLHYQPIR